MSTDTRTTVIARTVTRTVVPLVLLTAYALLFQGHNLPGGGFIAGVLTATGLALVYVIYGIDFLERSLLGLSPDEGGVDAGAVRVYTDAFAAGLAVAAGGGVVAMALEYPFLTQAVAFLEGVPVFGHLEVASAFVFDLGVYLVVVGALLAILGVIGAE